MTVQEINRVHQRYITLSNTFKAAWTFHQFLEGLRKVYPEEGLAGYAADFQAVYRRLKGISENLNEVGAARASDQLRAVEKELEPLTEALGQADLSVAPTRLRQFFERVRNYDDGILTQLVKFYLFTQPAGTEWPIDRLDKADFLLTRLSEEIDETTGATRLRDPAYLRDLTQGLWHIVAPRQLGDDDTKPAAAGALEADQRAALEGIEAVRREIEGVESIEEMTMFGLVHRYRELKHGLGASFFHPELVRCVVETNLALKNRVTELYAREEQRIVAEYQQIFELERDVPQDNVLREELTAFRRAVERFEAQLQGSNVRLESLADVQRRVRELLPQLRAADDTGAFATPPTETLPATAGEPSAAADLGEDLGSIASDFLRLYEALGNTNPSADAKKVTLDPEVFGFGLEPREVIAFRRLSGRETCARRLETFLLGSAALRVKILETVEAIKAILDDTSVTREGPEFTAARRVLRVADRVARRFGHLVEESMMLGDLEEAQQRKLLEMRMVRTYSGLWLMLHRP